MIYLRYDPATNLGNYMFQIAFASAVDSDADIAFVTADERGRERLDRYRELYPYVRIVPKVPEGTRVFDERDEPGALPQVRKGEDVFIKGFVQYPQFFDAVRVRELFACPKRIEQLIDAKYGSLLKRKDLVSIHVRRGDYLKLSHRHPFVGKKYLREAVSRFPKGEFVVCSDDIPWCKSFFKGDRFHFMEGNEVLADLFIAARCTSHICSNSTFSWWGAYLDPHPNKRVVFPSMWFGYAIKQHPDHLYWPGVEIITNGYEFDILIRAFCKSAREMLGRILRKAGLLR